jgi:predicted nucleic acid-binding protein
MSAADRFFDTNVLLYLLSEDDARADCAERELSEGGVLSVQVLNEFAAVASRKLRMPLAEIREFLSGLREICKVVPLTDQTHDLGMQIAEKHGLPIYDAMIVASALLAGCRTLVTEDLQAGRRFEGRLAIRNPFAGLSA